MMKWQQHYVALTYRQKQPSISYARTLAAMLRQGLLIKKSVAKATMALWNRDSYPKGLPGGCPEKDYFALSYKNMTKSLIRDDDKLRKSQTYEAACISPQPKKEH